MLSFFHFYRYSDEVVDRGEFIKKCGERWKTMTAKEKNKFNQMQELDKKRFQTEMQVYNQVQKCEFFGSTQIWLKYLFILTIHSAKML